MKSERRSSQVLEASNLLKDLLFQIETGIEKRKISITEWAQKLILGGGRRFSFKNHEFEREMLKCDFPRQCVKKGAQVGVTEVNVIKTLYGMIIGKYPQGVLYLFPTALDVSDFTKGRFNTLIRDNPEEIGSFIQETDSVSIKRVNKSMLYLRGARSTSIIGDIKKSSSQLKGVPVDRIVFDEMDEMEPAMIDLARERISHSEVKEEIYISTPSLPDYGIDKLYQQSDQRIWLIRCEHCGAETCLELEFPLCLMETPKGVIRVCKKCKREIFPRNGQWVAQYPERSKDLVGWWISQLNSEFVDPGEILRAFYDPPNGNITEVYNSKLGMAYVTADNRLSISDISACIGLDAMSVKEDGPCAMGVDVGRVLHVVIGFKPQDRVYQICFLGRVEDFNELSILAKRFNVQCCVIDAEPETRKAREFQNAEPYPVFLCDYIEYSTGGINWDESRNYIKASRTELCDTTHELFINPGQLILPRKNEEVDRFIHQVRNIAKILEEDKETGSKVYRYRKLGEDHYRHALNYFYLACQRIGLSGKHKKRFERDLKAEIDFDIFKKNYGHEDIQEGWNIF